jgi:hypothetical protein
MYTWMLKFKMLRLSAQTLFAFVFRTVCQNLLVASPSARVLAAMRAKVVPHVATGLGGAGAFQFALQEMGNDKDEEEESHDDDEKSCIVSMYHKWYRYWSTSNTLLFSSTLLRVVRRTCVL